MSTSSASFADIRAKLRQILYTKYVVYAAKVYEMVEAIYEAAPEQRLPLAEDLLTMFDLVPLDDSYLCPRTVPATEQKLDAATEHAQSLVSAGTLDPNQIFQLAQTPSQAAALLLRHLDIVGEKMPLARTAYLHAIVRSPNVPFLKHIEVREHITSTDDHLVSLSRENLLILQEAHAVAQSPDPFPATAEWLMGVQSRVNDPAKAKALIAHVLQRVARSVVMGAQRHFEQQLEMYKAALAMKGMPPAAGSC